MTSENTAEPTIDSQALAPFRVAQLRFDIEAGEPLNLPPYKGSTIRGGFGHALKKTVCVKDDPGDCTPCMLGNTCPYGYLFETSPPEDSEVLSNLQSVPVPFWIDVDDERGEIAPGERLTFDLGLVGRAINYVPYVILAFQELGRLGLGKSRGKYALQRVRTVHPWTGNAGMLYDGIDIYADTMVSIEHDDILQRAESLAGDRVTLHFHTPTRLKYQGTYVREAPAFHVVFRTLLRRISSLSYFHCGEQWDIDYRGWIDTAKAVDVVDADVRWHDWGRYSGRQQRGISMGGIVGRVTYDAGDDLDMDLTPFLPVLCLGELLHVGKGTAFGNGRYEVVG